MRTVRTAAISELISELCIRANVHLRPDYKRALQGALKKETSPRAKHALKLLLENAKVASKERLPYCQDTGLAVVFMEIGQEVRIAGGSLKKAVDKGVRDGYRVGYLRKSAVDSPLTRKNTGTNGPAVLHTDIVPGDKIKIWIIPKGFGSENKSRLAMLNPSDGEEGVIDFVVDTVRKAGPEACPPLVLGVGIGGSFDYAGYLAKKALLRRLDRKNPDKKLAALEKKILSKVNKLGLGPMGLGGKTSAAGVSILSYPTHIAALPVAVNVMCHADRSAQGIL